MENGLAARDEFAANVAAVRRIGVVPAMLDVICQTIGAGFAAVAIVTEDHWIACAVQDSVQFGVKPGDRFAAITMPCHQVRQNGNAVAASGITPDPARPYQSYISTPILLRDGSLFGTLCALDPRPIALDTPANLAMFQLFAELLKFHLDALHASSDTPAISELTKQFLAVLGHDLRNPLATINMSAWALGRARLSKRAASAVDVIRHSVVRMSGLLDNMLDFAGGRLDGRMVLERDADEPLEPVLHAVVNECRASWPDRTIELHCALAVPVNCDRGRIAHLCSNLLRNALAYGAENRPVRVDALCHNGIFELSVTNHGDPIPPELQKQLIEHPVRGVVRPGPHGAGLGLYVASAIARAHGGKLTVQSSVLETRFTFLMELA